MTVSCRSMTCVSFHIGTGSGKKEEFLLVGDLPSLPNSPSRNAGFTLGFVAQLGCFSESVHERGRPSRAWGVSRTDGSPGPGHSVMRGGAGV